LLKRFTKFNKIEYLISWVENQIHNETIFPQEMGVDFPINFLQIIKVIFKRLFRVYAHIYHAHFSDIMVLEIEAHLNTSFKHFIYFVFEFNLIEHKELTPLKDLITEFVKRKKDKIGYKI
jgi:MOB kinase activator 1